MRSHTQTPSIHQAPAVQSEDVLKDTIDALGEGGQDALHQMELRLRRQDEYLAALQETTTDLLSQFELDAVLENIVERAAQLMDTPVGYLGLVAPETGCLEPTVGLGALAESLKHIAPGEGLAGVVWATGAPLVIDDYASWEGSLEDFGAGKVGAIIGVPLVSGRQVHGVLSLAYAPGENRTFGQDAVDILNQFARLAVLAIHKARLFSGPQRELAERKRAEIALEDSSSPPQKMATEGTQEPGGAQEGLMRREKLVVLGQLTAGIGHELRAPLGIISNAVVLLDMLLPDADSEVRECLSIICNQVHRSDKIISDLLSFSRPRLADSLQQEHVAVPDLVKEVLQQVPPPENVEVRTRLDPDLPLLLIDRQQISQALINLTTNAYQAMPNGGRLTFSAGSNTHGVVVSVKDTGCGISPQHRQRLFEPLFTTKPRGIGLGLAVTRDLIQANRGTISVRSEEGVGSEFIIKLPLD